MLPSPAARAGPMMRDRRDGEECSAAAALRDDVDDAEVEESRKCSSASKTHATGQIRTGTYRDSGPHRAERVSSMACRCRRARCRWRCQPLRRRGKPRREAYK